MKTTTIVTGASGMLGNRIADVLTQEGHRVVATANSNVDLVWAKIDTVERCDLSDPEAVARLYSTHEPSVVIHAAALANVDLCEREPALAYRHNVIATRNVVHHAARTGAHLVAISTSSVFDGEVGDYREGDTPRPRNYYSWTKLIAEEIASAGTDATIVRATPIGIHPLRRTPFGFLEWLVSQLRADANLNLFTDIAINPVSDTTLSNVIARIVNEKIRGRILHVGTREPCSKADIGKWIQATHFPNYRGTMKCDASDLFVTSANAVRSRQMWLNVEEVQKSGIATMPTIQAELESLARSIGPKF